MIPGSRGHHTQISRGELEWRAFDPMALGATRIDVGTRDDYCPGLAEIVAFCEPTR
jgi:hypothetical protein